jgi:hypoxanthine phosphoribosyltransferase
MQNIDEMNNIDDIKEELKGLYALRNQIGNRVLDASTDAYDVDGTALSKENIAIRTKIAAMKIIESHVASGATIPPVLVGVMDGALPFLMGIRNVLDEIGFEYEYTTMQTESYHGITSGELTLRSAPKLPLGAQRIYVIEDVYDTGQTYDGIQEYLKAQGVELKDINLVTLVDKKQPRKADIDSSRLISCFILPKSAFIIGDGLDYYGCRNTPDIRVVNLDTIATEEEEAKLNRIKPLNARLRELISLKKAAIATASTSNNAASNIPGNVASTAKGFAPLFSIDGAKVQQQLDAQAQAKNQTPDLNSEEDDDNVKKYN